MFYNILENVRKKAPLIHSITNNVTANDCANILLASGASPIMAEAPEEAEEITSVCDGLSLNLGTLTQSKLSAMLISGQAANRKGIPVLLDPVGAGSSQFRTQGTHELLKKVRFSVIRVNCSELKALISGEKVKCGVDVRKSDKITEYNLDNTIEIAKELSKKYKSIIVVTGAFDIVTDGNKTIIIENGNPMMSSVTGSGCMLSSLITAFISANSNNIFYSTAAAVCTMGLCGEKAFQRLKCDDGNSSYRNYIIDGIFNLSEKELIQGAKYELR